MDGKDKSMPYLLKNSRSDGSGFEDETKDNLRQRSTKHTETKENYTTPSDMTLEINEKSVEFVHKVCDKGRSWSLVHHSQLPQWLQDNEFLLNWHRPPLPSFSECFKSIFILHTETGNIWTHLVGCAAFIAVMIYFLPMTPVVIKEKIILSAFFVGAILCLGFSTFYHTVMCHSESISISVRKLDYCGISCLIMGSMVPWIYYIFYCDYISKLIYISMVVILGIITLTFSLWDKFGTPEYRTIRSISFVIFGLSAVIPAVHFMYIMDWNEKINISSMQCTFLFAVLYIFGAVLYAARVPEKLNPGKYDIWFQSHQFFHILVVAGAFVTYHALKELAAHRHMYIECAVVNISNITSEDLSNAI